MEWPVVGNTSFPSWPRSPNGRTWMPRQGVDENTVFHPQTSTSNQKGKGKRKRNPNGTDTDKRPHKNPKNKNKEKDEQHYSSSDNDNNDDHQEDHHDHQDDDNHGNSEGVIGEGQTQEVESGEGTYGFGSYTIEDLQQRETGTSSLTMVRTIF